MSGFARPDFRKFRGISGVSVVSDDQLEHSAKGSTWEEHKYVKVIDGVYYYPVGYENGRTVDSLKDSDKKEKDEDFDSEKELAKVKDHFDEYMKERGVNVWDLPKDQIDEMQRAIAKEIKSGNNPDKILKELSGDSDSSSSKKSVDELANEVIRGKHGNGDDRKASLGDDYAEVQKKVNELMKSAGSQKVSSKSDPSVQEQVKAALDGVKDNRVKVAAEAWNNATKKK